MSLFLIYWFIFVHEDDDEEDELDKNNAINIKSKSQQNM